MIQEGFFYWKRCGLAEAKTGDTVSVDAGFFNSIESTSVKEAITEAEGWFPTYVDGKPIVSYDAKVVNDPARGKVWEKDSGGLVSIQDANAFMQEVGADNMADGYWSVDDTGKILSPYGVNADDYAVGALATCGLVTETLRSNKIILGIKGSRTLKANGRVVRPAVYRKSYFFQGVPPSPSSVFIVEIESAEFVNSVYIPESFLTTDFRTDAPHIDPYLYYMCPSGENFIQVKATPHTTPNDMYVELGDRLKEEYHKFNYYQEHYIWFVSSDINGYTVSLPRKSDGDDRGGYLHLLRASHSGLINDDLFAEQIISGHGDVRPSYDSITIGDGSASVSGVTIKEAVSVNKEYSDNDLLPSQVAGKLLFACSEEEKVDFAYNVMGFNRYDENSKVIGYGPEGSSTTYVTVSAESETKTDGLAVRLRAPRNIKYTVSFNGLMKVSVTCTWKRGGYGDGKVYITLVSESPMDWSVPVWLSEDNSTDADFLLSGDSTTTVSHELDLSEVGAQRSPNGSVSFDLYIGVWMLIGKFDIVISQKRVSA